MGAIALAAVGWQGCEGRLWDRRKSDDAALLHKLDGHSQDAAACTFLQWGTKEFAVTGSKDNTIRVWDVGTGHCNSVTTCGRVTSVAAAPEESDGDLFATTSDGGMHVYSVNGEGSLECLATSGLQLAQQEYS